MEIEILGELKLKEKIIYATNGVKYDENKEEYINFENEIKEEEKLKSKEQIGLYDLVILVKGENIEILYSFFGKYYDYDSIDNILKIKDYKDYDETEEEFKSRFSPVSLMQYQYSFDGDIRLYRPYWFDGGGEGLQYQRDYTIDILDLDNDKELELIRSTNGYGFLFLKIIDIHNGEINIYNTYQSIY